MYFLGYGENSHKRLSPQPNAHIRRPIRDNLVALSHRDPRRDSTAG
jgi:hypothetical protein